MCRNGQVVLEVLIFFYQLQYVFAADIAVFANETVIFLVLAEHPDTGGKDNQLTAVGNGHACAVNRLIAEPCALEFAGIEVHNHLFQRLVHEGEVRVLAFGNSFFKVRTLGADIQAVNKDVVCHVCGNGQHKQERNTRKEVFLRVVKHLANRGEILAHNALHAVESTQHMGAVNHAVSAATDENILGIVGHAHHLVGNNLADRNNQVVGRVEKAIDKAFADAVAECKYQSGM